jgi:hypothetical protein
MLSAAVSRIEHSFANSSKFWECVSTLLEGMQGSVLSHPEKKDTSVLVDFGLRNDGPRGASTSLCDLQGKDLDWTTRTTRWDNGNYLRKPR